MFSFVPVVLLAAIIARTQALECYSGMAAYFHPATTVRCPPGELYCFSLTANDNPSFYGCGPSGICNGYGCRTIDGRTLCCCDSNLCNRG